jgi:hypothetical protein
MWPFKKRDIQSGKKAHGKGVEHSSTSAEYWQQSKDAISNGDIDKAAQLAFQARKKEAQSRGDDLSEDAIFGNPLHAKRAASEVDRFEIPIDGVSEETIAKLKAEVTLGVLKGEGPRATERQTRDFLEDFEWPEFDQLCNKFMSTNEWPPFLDIVPAYYEMQTFPIERLLKELKKEQLLQLSREYSVNAKKYQTKEVIIKLLINIIPERDRAKILALVNEKWKLIYLREKRSLLVHMLCMGAYHDSSLSEYEAAEKVIGLPVKVQWWTACDERVCSICSSRHGKIYTRAEVKKIGMPHPGCRCAFLPYIVDPLRGEHEDA